MLLYLRTWVIIKRKQLLNVFQSKENTFTKFAIVCAPRSGSTWLHTLLNSHPQIVSYGEILRETHELNVEKELPSLGEIVFHPHHSSIKAVGLKVFYEYETESAYKNSFDEILKDKTICILHLVRDDKASQFKSLKQAEKTQIWSSGTETQKNDPIPVDVAELEAYQNKILATEHRIDEVFHQHPLLKIKYEDLIANEENILTAVQHFLNVKPRRLFSLLKKQST